MLKVIESLKAKGIKVGGVLTPELREAGKRVAFLVKDVHTGAEALLASTQHRSPYKVSKYYVSIKNFERIALPALDFALKGCKVTVVDEIGKMELLSQVFKQKLEEILKSDKLLLATVHRSYALQYARYGKLFEVKPENRGALIELILKEIHGNLSSSQA